MLERPNDGWQGYRGYITTDVLRSELPQNYHELHTFVCGPLPMMTAIRKCLGQLDMPEKNVHYEEFKMA